MKLRGLALAVLLAVASNAVAAPSAPASDDKALAETLFFAGRGLMEAERYEEACAKFAESYRLDAAAGTLLNLAVCHEKVGKIASAWGEYRKAAADAKKAGRLDRWEFAETRARALEPELPYLRITVPPAARWKGLEILRNGRALLEPAWDTELPVDPGPVELIVRAPGYKEQKLAATLERREHRSLTVPILEPAPVAFAPVRVIDRGWTTTRAVGATVFLVGLASAGAAAYFAVRAAESKRLSDEGCPVYDGERRCTSAGVEAMTTANTRAWLANGSAAIAVAGLGLGTYLYVIGGRKAQAPQAGALHLDVAASGAGVSAVLSGAF